MADGREPEHDALEGYLVTEMIDELHKISDPAEALRKALLAMLLLTGEHSSPAMRSFAEFLLGQFEPVAGAFEENAHRLPLFEGIEVMRALAHEGNLALFLPVERMASKMGRKPRI